jgi:hypothetical protein
MGELETFGTDWLWSAGRMVLQPGGYFGQRRTHQPCLARDAARLSTRASWFIKGRP